jgi:hypothetical protein
MVNKIKLLFNSIKNWFDVKSQNSSLRLRLVQEMAKVGDPKEVLKKSFPNLEWYDYNDLPPQERLNYYNEAQAILRTKIFHNEISRLKATLAVDTIMDAVKFEQIRDYQMTINGLELLKQTLESIMNPNKLPDLDDDILAPI